MPGPRDALGSAPARGARRALTLAALLLAPPAALFLARSGEAARRNPRSPNGPFLFESEARRVLRGLWQESSGRREERVACLGGHYDGHIFHIARAERVHLQFADSFRVDPAPSIDQCAPPAWLGTAHTHIARVRGRPQLPTFSGSDRTVMAQWRFRWKTEGVFCVLFSETAAYCEYGLTLSGDAVYFDGREPAGSP